MRTIEEELKELRDILHSDRADREEAYQTKFNDIQARYTSEADRNAIADFLLEGYCSIGQEAEELSREITLQERVKEMKEIIPVSYIARHYFGKSTAWLQQRIYGYKVRGKVYTLNEKDLETFHFALQDISKKISSLSIA